MILFIVRNVYDLPVLNMIFLFLLQGNTHFMRKIPPGSEASNIMVGEVPFLDKPVTAFVRLNNSANLGNLTEVPVPTRFLYIILGPVVSISILF